MEGIEDNGLKQSFFTKWRSLFHVVFSDQTFDRRPDGGKVSLIEGGFSMVVYHELS